MLRHRHVDAEEIDTTLRQPLDDHGNHRDEIELNLATGDRDVRQFLVVLVQEGLHLHVDLTIEVHPQFGECRRGEESFHLLLDEALDAARDGAGEEGRLRREVRDGGQSLLDAGLHVQSEEHLFREPRGERVGHGRVVGKGRDERDEPIGIRRVRWVQIPIVAATMQRLVSTTRMPART